MVGATSSEGRETFLIRYCTGSIMTDGGLKWIACNVHRLHIAASRGLMKVIDVCLRQSANVNVRDANGQSLHINIIMVVIYYHHITLQPFYGPFSGTTRASRCQKRTSGLYGRKVNRDRHADHPAGRHSIRTNQCLPPPSPIFFYRPDALPAAQPTTSKH